MDFSILVMGYILICYAIILIFLHFDQPKEIPGKQKKFVKMQFITIKKG